MIFSEVFILAIIEIVYTFKVNDMQTLSTILQR